MKKVTIITSEDCPYCKKAKVLLDRILYIHPGYAEIETEYMDAAEADKKKIYYDKLPCFYIGDMRAFEGYIKIDKLLQLMEAAKNEEAVIFTSEE